MNYINLLITTVLLSYQAISTQHAFDSTERDINALYEDLREGYQKLDHKKVASVYSNGASYLPSFEGPLIAIQNKTEMVRDMEGWFNKLKEDKLSLDIVFRLETRKITKEVVYDVGYYTVTYLGNDKTETGKMINIFEKEDGKWKFHVDMYSNAPDEKAVRGESTFEE